eukprot:534410-Hanusia_phi.AAC.1
MSDGGSFDLELQGIHRVSGRGEDISRACFVPSQCTKETFAMQAIIRASEGQKALYERLGSFGEQMQ